MKEHVQRRTCDRCGAVAFEVYSKTTDCGFYFKHDFEPADGWIDKEDYGDLCPSCVEALEKTRQKFMQGYAL